MWAPPQGLRCLGPFCPGAVGPGKGVFVDICFVGRAAFDAALSLVLGIFVAVDLLLRLGLGLDLGRFFVAVSARF